MLRVEVPGRGEVVEGSFFIGAPLRSGASIMPVFIFCGKVNRENCASELARAAQKGDVARLRQLLAAGVDVNAVERSAEEIFAEQMRSITEAPPPKPSLFWRIVRLLPARLSGFLFGAKFALVDLRKTLHSYEASKTPLMHAVEHGHGDAVRLLLEAGADVNATATWGLTGECTALMMAAEKGDVDILALLLAQGAHINAVDETEQSALMFAAVAGNIACVEHLAEQGAALDARDMDGADALMLAALNGRTEVVRFLLAQGMDANATDEEGDSVLDYAAQCDGKPRAEIIRLLREAGAREAG